MLASRGGCRIMKRKNVSRLCGVGAFALWCVFALVGATFGATMVWAQAPDGQSGDAREAPIGAGKTFVTAKFGGSIFGFDIDQNGTEGVLSEGQTLPNGKTLAAVETFDQATGMILDVVVKTENRGDLHRPERHGGRIERGPNPAQREDAGGGGNF